MAGLVLNFNACSEQSPLQSDAAEVLNGSLAKKGGGGPGGSNGGGSQDNSSYPQSGSVSVFFNHDLGKYNGASMNLDNGSRLRLTSGSLTPPPGTRAKSKVVLEMQADMAADGTEIIFTFGPHGSQFDPPVELILDWRDLGVNAANLYYIDPNGNRILQTPDHMDVHGRNLTLYIDHFSRYAINAGE